MLKLFTGAEVNLPTKASYVQYLMEISSSILPHIAESIANEVWDSVSESKINSETDEIFMPSAAFEIDVLMTIPL